MLLWESETLDSRDLIVCDEDAGSKHGADSTYLAREEKRKKNNRGRKEEREGNGKKRNSEGR